jgi:hypothetical protein
MHDEPRRRATGRLPNTRGQRSLPPTFAHCGRDTFGRASSDIAHDEQSRIAGLERERSPTQRLPSPIQLLLAEGPVGEYLSDGRRERRIPTTSLRRR